MKLHPSSYCRQLPAAAVFRRVWKAGAAAAAHALIAVPLVVGCQRQVSDSRHSDSDPKDIHAHEPTEAHGHAHGHGHGHGHEEESPSGASYKAGRGVRLTEETRKLMGLEVADVTERLIPRWVRFTLQVFDEKHRHPVPRPDGHSGCEMYGAGFVSSTMATNVVPGQRVETHWGTNRVFGGTVLAVRTAYAPGESEVVVGISNAVDQVKAGAFLPARVRLAGESPVPAVPESAVLRTSKGAFVFAVNGESYLRTAVKTGSEGDGWVEIVDGLLAGDAVVTTPVEALYLIELRATKGGGHTH